MIRQTGKALLTLFIIAWAPVLVVTLALGPFAFIGWLATRILS